MEGPFAEKLQAATAGHEPPRFSPDASHVAESLDLSGGGKSRRERRKGKREEYEREQRKREDGEGVSGRAVHTRGSFIEVAPVEAAVESPELQKAKRLFGEVTAQCEVLGRLHAFMDANGYKDSEGNLSETVATRLERANRTMLPLKEGGVITAAEVSNLAELLEESNQDIDDLKEALEGLESAGELVLPPEIKSLLETKSDLSRVESESEVESVNSGRTPVPAKAHPEADNHEQSLAEKRSYASFNADELRALWRKQGVLDRINMVADQLKEWQTFDQAIRKFKDEERFKDDLKVRGLGEKYDQVLRLTGRGENIATRLEEIRKSFEEKGELDQKEAAFLTAIFFDYHELLVVAEGVVADRDRETPIVEAEKEARAKRAAEKKEKGLVASLEESRGRILKQLRSIKTKEQFDQLESERPDNPIYGGRIDTEGLRLLFGDQYPENDERLIEKLLQLANEFQSEINTLYQETKERVSAEVEKGVRNKGQEGVVKVAAETPDTALEKKTSFQDKVARLKDLLDQWKALEDEFGDDALRQAVRSLRRLEKREKLPPTGKIAKWFTEHDSPKAWQGRNAAADRALLVNDALPGMESMVQDGRLVAEKLRKERSESETATPPAPPTAERKDDEPIVRGDIWEAPPKDSTHAGRRIVVSGVTPEGKIEYRFYNFDGIGSAQNMGFGMHDSERTLREWLATEGYAYKERREDELGPPAASVLTLDRRPVIDGELTEWERMNPVEQNRLKRELFTRKDRFVSGLNDRLKRAGVNDGDRRNTIIKYLDEYLPQMIELVVKVPLQDTDRESLLRDLKKELAIA